MADKTRETKGANGGDGASAEAEAVTYRDAPAGEAPRADAPLVIHGQYVKDLSFENPKAPQSFMQPHETPEVSITVNVQTTTLENNAYDVALAINAVAKSNAETVFVVELVYGGVFSLNNVPDEHVQPLLLIEAPRLLFPFARNIVADVTRDGGFPPLMIQPIDFLGLYQQQHEAETDAPAQA